MIKGFAKKLIMPVLAGSLILSACNEVVEDPIDKRVQELIKIDKNYEPELEIKIEQTFGVNILGEKVKLTDKVLKQTFDQLSEPKASVAGIKIILGEVICGKKFPNCSGRYIINTIFGPVIFDNRSSYFILPHELTHHIDFSNPQKAESDVEWNNVETTMHSNGKLIETNTRDAIMNLRRNKNRWRLIDENGTSFEIFGGLFGFVRPYAIAGQIYNADRINSEDKATYSEIIRRTKGPNLDLFNYWDESFDVLPYIKKINILQKYGIVREEKAQDTINYLQTNADMFKDIRENGDEWFSDLERKITSGELIPSCKEYLIENNNELYCMYTLKSENLGDEYNEKITTNTSGNLSEDRYSFNVNLARFKNNGCSKLLMSYNDICAKQDNCFSQMKLSLTNFKKRNEYAKRFEELAKVLKERHSLDN